MVRFNLNGACFDGGDGTLPVAVRAHQATGAPPRPTHWERPAWLERPPAKKQSAAAGRSPSPPPVQPAMRWAPTLTAPRLDYSMMLATTPAPTVRPPSRMAKRSFSSIAIGTISVTSIDTLSPGITISVPSGSVTTPVTSVVRK